MLHVQIGIRLTTGTSAGWKKPSTIGYWLMCEHSSLIPTTPAAPLAEWMITCTCTYVWMIRAVTPAVPASANHSSPTMSCDIHSATESVRTAVLRTGPSKCANDSTVVSNAMHSIVIRASPIDPAASVSRSAACRSVPLTNFTVVAPRISTTSIWCGSAAAHVNVDPDTAIRVSTSRVGVFVSTKLAYPIAAGKSPPDRMYVYPTASICTTCDAIVAPAPACSVATAPSAPAAVTVTEHRAMSTVPWLAAPASDTAPTPPTCHVLSCDDTVSRVCPPRSSAPVSPAYTNELPTTLM